MLLNKRIPIKYIFGKIQWELLAITIYSLVVGLTDHHFFSSAITIPLAVPAILGTTISLILAFRTGQSYDRWWEARIIWGAIVNDSRTLIRQLLEFSNNDDKEFITKFTNRQVAWIYSLGERLRGLTQIATITKFLTQEEVKAIKNHSNIPNSILDLHAKDLKQLFAQGHINQYQQIQLDSTLRRLCDSMGKSERIKTTVFPRTYNVMLHILIYVFATIFPFSLMQYSVVMEALLNVIITSMFFMVEKTAIYKQDPFENRPTDTPMTRIAQTIEINLMESIKAERIPALIDPDTYYIL